MRPLAQGLTCPQIAERAQVSAEAVRDLLAEYGIARRSGCTRKEPAASRQELAATG
ncbi:hypothetical protein ACIA5D_22920 [Actinoplanes sp. NPDC051513]|uniref:hypothetical protein n=1 Tax=Actinoplanes sp. NPDC051513 TaxID=3363908 RepID=UPI00378DAB98